MTTDIAAEVAAERERQDAQWGGPVHDDVQKPWDWMAYVIRQCSRGHEELNKSDGGVVAARPIVRARLVKIAALAFAGIAAIDRLAGGDETTPMDLIFDRGSADPPDQPRPTAPETE